jgi:hypothetical protein
MPVSKFSQITPAGTNMVAGDALLAVRGGNTDVLLSGAQAAAFISNVAPIAIIDRGTVNAGTVIFDVSASCRQKLTVGGALSINFSGWPGVGFYQSIQLQIVNGGVGVTWATPISWILGDGTVSAVFTDMGVTLQNPGVNSVFIESWSGGTTLYGRAD